MQVTTALAPAESFPGELPIGYVSLAGFELVSMPGEVSTAQGAAIRAALRYTGAGLGHGKIELIGLADENSSYISTPSEYALQDYMGASTIWGPNEGPFFACTAADLKKNPRPATTRVGKLKFFPGATAEDLKLLRGQKVDFGPAFIGDARVRT